ncbi:hypothetical protein DFP72DRAFT_1043184 [Ephemerocybe angulata]|uniref:DUF6533 domain-containing protein n=1 Tax=Ephemerocybe angulata TaxID=980116 RepID=A0A8H6I923_9AGAR|nr:hypothetical protein DFP72DRAFT_1043184 [Tulosesus angulatus]
MVTQIQKQFTASAWTLLVFDYVLTFETEVTTIWTASPWPLGRFGTPLFYLSRYFPLIDEAMLVYYGRSTDSAQTCERVYMTATWMAAVSGIACHTIVYLHTCALWGRKRIVVILLGVLLVATFSAFVGVTVIQSTNATFKGAFDPPFAGTPGCRLMASNPNSYRQGIYITGLTTEAVTVTLMLVRGLQHVRQSRDSWVLTLYSTGILYCVVIFLLNLANAVALNLPAMARHSTILVPLQHAMRSILCSRLVFAILQRRKMQQSNARSASAADVDGIEESKNRNIREEFTSIDECPSHSMDGIELQAFGRGFSTGGSIKTGIYDQRW